MSATPELVDAENVAAGACGAMPPVGVPLGALSGAGTTPPVTDAEAAAGEAQAAAAMAAQSRGRSPGGM